MNSVLLKQNARAPLFLIKSYCSQLLYVESDEIATFTLPLIFFFHLLSSKHTCFPRRKESCGPHCSSLGFTGKC